MKAFAVIAGLAVVAMTYLLITTAPSQGTQDQFALFLQQHGRNYVSHEEYVYRLSVFEENLNKIAELNKVNPHATFSVNQFADRTEKEMQKRMGTIVPEGRVSNKPRTIKSIEGKSVDWSDMWTGIKNQGQCGSCWAFSATATFEARWAIAHGIKPVSELFAEQELVDCVSTCYGCNGGFMDYAFDYLTSHGFCHSSDYVYTARDGTCQDSKCTTGPKDSGFSDIPDDHEDAVLEELLNGPVAVAVDASTWSFYSGGVLSSCGVSLNHGVTLVGSNFEADVPFVTIRNSWGASWGEKGHIRLAIGSDVCGYADAASVPTY